MCDTKRNEARLREARAKFAKVHAVNFLFVSHDRGLGSREATPGTSCTTREDEKTSPAASTKSERTSNERRRWQKATRFDGHGLFILLDMLVERTAPYRLYKDT